MDLSGFQFVNSSISVNFINFSDSRSFGKSVAPLLRRATIPNVCNRLHEYTISIIVSSVALHCMKPMQSQ